MEKLWLDVPYSDNDEVRSLGGRFDSTRRQWWVWDRARDKVRPWLSELLLQADSEFLDWLAPDPIRGVVGPIVCHRCGAAVHCLWVEAWDGNYRVHGEESGVYCASTLVQFDEALVGRADIALAVIKRRFSRTVGSSYFSQGCKRCDALFGEMPLGEWIAQIRAEENGELLTVPLDAGRFCKTFELYPTSGNTSKLVSQALGM